MPIIIVQRATTVFSCCRARRQHKRYRATLERPLLSCRRGGPRYGRPSRCTSLPLIRFLPFIQDPYHQSPSCRAPWTRPSCPRTPGIHPGNVTVRMIGFSRGRRVDQNQRMPARIVDLVGRIIVSMAIVVGSAIIIAGAIVVPGAIVAIVFVVLSPLLCGYRASDHPKRHPCESCPCRISPPMVMPVAAGRTEISGATRCNGCRDVPRRNWRCRSCEDRRLGCGENQSRNRG